jgi:multidrug resistance efflux pump
MVAGLAVAGTLAAGGTVWLLSGSEPATPVSARTVERVSSEGVTAKGTVQPVSTQTLSFSLSGTVTAVSVKPGDMVVVGQTLARIDQADAQQAVADAQSALDDAEAALDAAIASASAAASPTPSCTKQSAPAPRASASASQPSPAASSSSSPVRAEAVSTTQCSTGGSGSTNGNAQRGGSGSDSILSAQQDVNNDKAALAKAQRQLAGTVIKSPVSGKVLDVAIKVGDTARSNVITLGVVSTMVVKASFSEADVVALTVGESATVALPGHKDETFTAKITQIAETGTVSDNLVTYAVILTFDKVPDGILVGQSANVTVAA